MHKNRIEILKRIALRRFRHKIRRKAFKKRLRRQSIVHHSGNRAKWKRLGKGIKLYSDLVRIFMPETMLYLLTEEQSPFYFNKLSRPTKIVFKRTISVPKTFSIIDNPKQSYHVLRELVSCLFYQSCSNIDIDYANCYSCDLVTQLMCDTILSDFIKFMKRASWANKDRHIRIQQIGGSSLLDPHLKKMMWSIGSPVSLKNKSKAFDDVVPFKQIRFDANNTSNNKRLNQKEIDSTRCIDYVNECLKRFNSRLTNDAARELGCVVGETIINAEEHSSLKVRYLIGYFEEDTESEQHSGLFNLVIMNFGQSIYDKFKYPYDGNVNQKCVNQMETLSKQFQKKGIFSSSEFTEENLWTLYSLQRGVTCVPDYNRGNGTIEFINSFFKLKGSVQVDDVSRMYILSGGTIIEFDGTYMMSDLKDENGNPQGIISFNESGSLHDKPNPKYVRSAPCYFPGTAICVKLKINEDDIRSTSNVQSII